MAAFSASNAASSRRLLRRSRRAPSRARRVASSMRRRSPCAAPRARSRAGCAAARARRARSASSRSPSAGGRRLVDEVDGLVGQEPVGDVALAQRRGRHERRVGDADAVVDLVALAEAAEDRDRLLDGRLVDDDRLEASLEGGVLLDVLAVLIERRRADGVKLATGEHRLEQVGGVHRPRRPHRRRCAARR